MNGQESIDKIYNIENFNKEYKGFCDSISEGFKRKEEKEFIEKLNFYSSLKFKDADPLNYLEEAIDFFQENKYSNIIVQNNNGEKFRIGIDGNRLIQDIDNLYSNPKIKLKFKDILIQAIDSYIEIKVINKLLSYFFPEENSNLDIVANKFYFLFRKIFNHGKLITDIIKYEKSVRKFYPNYSSEILNILERDKFCSQFNFSYEDYYEVMINGCFRDLKKIGHIIFPQFYSAFILNKEYELFESDGKLKSMKDSKNALLYPILYTLISNPNKGKDIPKPEGADYLSKRNWARQIINFNKTKYGTGIKN